MQPQLHSSGHESDDSREDKGRVDDSPVRTRQMTRIDSSNHTEGAKGHTLKRAKIRSDNGDHGDPGSKRTKMEDSDDEPLMYKEIGQAPPVVKQLTMPSGPIRDDIKIALGTAVQVYLPEDEQWYESHIVGVRSRRGQIKIHFKGLNKRQDRWYDVNSPLIIPPMASTRLAQAKIGSLHIPKATRVNNNSFISGDEPIHTQIDHIDKGLIGQRESEEGESDSDVISKYGVIRNQLKREYDTNESESEMVKNENAIGPGSRDRLVTSSDDEDAKPLRLLVGHNTPPEHDNKENKEKKRHNALYRERKEDVREKESETTETTENITKGMGQHRMQDNTNNNNNNIQEIDTDNIRQLRGGKSVKLVDPSDIHTRRKANLGKGEEKERERERERERGDELTTEKEKHSVDMVKRIARAERAREREREKAVEKKRRGERDKLRYKMYKIKKVEEKERRVTGERGGEGEGEGEGERGGKNGIEPHIKKEPGLDGDDHDNAPMEEDEDETIAHRAIRRHGNAERINYKVSLRPPNPFNQRQSNQPTTAAPSLSLPTNALPTSTSLSIESSPPIAAPPVISPESDGPIIDKTTRVSGSAPSVGKHLRTPHDTQLTLDHVQLTNELMVKELTNNDPALLHRPRRTGMGEEAKNALFVNAPTRYDAVISLDTAAMILTAGGVNPTPTRQTVARDKKKMEKPVERERLQKCKYENCGNAFLTLAGLQSHYRSKHPPTRAPRKEKTTQEEQQDQENSEKIKEKVNRILSRFALDDEPLEITLEREKLRARVPVRSQETHKVNKHTQLAAPASQSTEVTPVSPTSPYRTLRSNTAIVLDDTTPSTKNRYEDGINPDTLLGDDNGRMSVRQRIQARRRNAPPPTRIMPRRTASGESSGTIGLVKDSNVAQVAVEGSAENEKRKASMDALKRIVQPNLVRNQRIYARWEVDNIFYPATITALNADGTYGVMFDDGLKGIKTYVDIIVATPKDAPKRRVSERKEKKKPVYDPEIMYDQEAGTVVCVCGTSANVGNMIQCEQCDVWYHYLCVGIEEDKIPDEYVCLTCKDQRYAHNSKEVLLHTTVPTLVPKARNPHKEKEMRFIQSQMNRDVAAIRSVVRGSALRLIGSSTTCNSTPPIAPPTGRPSVPPPSSSSTHIPTSPTTTTPSLPLATGASIPTNSIAPLSSTTTTTTTTTSTSIIPQQQQQQQQTTTGVALESTIEKQKDMDVSVSTAVISSTDPLNSNPSVGLIQSQGPPTDQVVVGNVGEEIGLVEKAPDLPLSWAEIEEVERNQMLMERHLARLETQLLELDKPRPNLQPLIKAYTAT